MTSTLLGGKFSSNTTFNLGEFSGLCGLGLTSGGLLILPLHQHLACRTSQTHRSLEVVCCICGDVSTVSSSSAEDKPETCRWT